MEGKQKVSDNCQNSSDATPSSSQCDNVITSMSNGYTTNNSTFPDDVDDSDTERAGVFDYIPQKPLPRNDASISSRHSDEVKLFIDDDEEAAVGHDWARETECNSNADYLNGREPAKELSTFRFSSDYSHLCNCDYRRHFSASSASNGVEEPNDSCTDSLENVVVQNEVLPRRVPYELYNPTPGVARYWPNSNTAPVYMTNIQQGGDTKNRYLLTDEHEAVDQRSPPTDQC